MLSHSGCLYPLPDACIHFHPSQVPSCKFKRNISPAWLVSQTLHKSHCYKRLEFIFVFVQHTHSYSLDIDRAYTFTTAVHLVLHYSSLLHQQPLLCLQCGKLGGILASTFTNLFLRIQNVSFLSLPYPTARTAWLVDWVHAGLK